MRATNRPAPASVLPTSFSHQLNALNHQLNVVPAAPQDFPAGAWVARSSQVTAAFGNRQVELLRRQFCSGFLGDCGNHFDP